MSSTASKSETSNGSVSDQDAAGESVTLTLTQPDNTTQTASAVTDASKGWVQTSPLTITQDGNYSLVAHVGQVGSFGASDSAPFTFTVSGITKARSVTIGAVSVT